jgi:hypothetical protein
MESMMDTDILDDLFPRDGALASDQFLPTPLRTIRSIIAARFTDENQALLDQIAIGHTSNFIGTRFIF